MKKILSLLLVLFTLFALASCQIMTSQSAYDIAVNNGFVGTEEEWLASLKGEKGEDGKDLRIRDIYDEYKIENPDYTGTLKDFIIDVFANLEYLEGDSAYQVAVTNGFTGTEEEWLASLKGEPGIAGSDGAPGSSVDLYTVYEKLVELGLYTSDYKEFAKEYLNGLTITSYKDVNNLVNQVVRVFALDVAYFDADFDKDTDIDTSISGASGAGVIFRLNKEANEFYFVTNYHVIYNESKKTEYNYVYAFMYGSERAQFAMKSEFIGGTAQYDLAVFKVTNELVGESNLVASTFADSDKVIVGSDAYAVGNPDGSGIAITRGIISCESETIELSPIKDDLTLTDSRLVACRVIRTDAPINHGNSGGALFDSNCQLIGIVNARSAASDVDDMGYAIPANVVRSIITNIMTNCYGVDNTYVKRCLMGITIENQASHSYIDEDGYTRIKETIRVADVTPGSAADGVVQVDDIVLRVRLNDIVMEVNHTYSIVDLCLSAKVGDTAVLTVIRDGVEMDLNMTFTTSVTVY